MPINVDSVVIKYPIEFGQEVLEVVDVGILEKSVVLVIRQKMDIALPEHTTEIEGVKIDPGFLSVKVRREIPISQEDVWRGKYPDELKNLTDEELNAKLPAVLEAHELRMQYGEKIPSDLNSDDVLLWHQQYKYEKAKQDAEATAKKVSLDALTKAMEKANMTPEQLIEKLNSL